MSLTHSSSRHLDPVPLTLISRSSDFVNILRRVWKIYVESRNKVHFSAAVVAVKMKPCIVIVLDTPFKQAPSPGALDLHCYAPLTLPNFSVKSRNKVHFSATVVAVGMNACIVIVLDTLFKHTS